MNTKEPTPKMMKTVDAHCAEVHSALCDLKIFLLEVHFAKHKSSCPLEDEIAVPRWQNASLKNSWK